MSLLLVAFVVMALQRWPSGAVGRAGLIVAIIAVLVVLGFDIADRTLPSWVTYTFAVIMLAFMCISIARNEDGRREQWGTILRRWFVSWPRA